MGAIDSSDDITSLGRSIVRSGGYRKASSPSPIPNRSSGHDASSTQ
jgi:hypothetical protein